MDTEIWAAIGTTIATLVLFIIPGVVYTWYALEHMIGDKESYASVVAQSNRDGRNAPSLPEVASGYGVEGGQSAARVVRSRHRRALGAAEAE
jgi:hypothetical protein